LNTLKTRDFRHSLTMELLTAPDEFEAAARFSLEIFENCIDDPVHMGEECQLQLGRVSQPSTILYNALFFCHGSFDVCADRLFTTALQSKDSHFQSAVFRLFANEPFLTRAQDRPSGLFSQPTLNQPQSRPFPQVSGLLNLGCTCDMNSVLQQLCGHPLFFTTLSSFPRCLPICKRCKTCLCRCGLAARVLPGDCERRCQSL
jgi:hypothetical protein